MTQSVQQPSQLAGGFILLFKGQMPLGGAGRHCQADSWMEVTLYSRPGSEVSQRIRELLREKGVEFDELDGERTVAVVDGVAIPGTRRAQIEQAIGWIGC